MSMTDPSAVDKTARRYKCCEHCLVWFGECADGEDHSQPCPEDDENCPGKQPLGGAE